MADWMYWLSLADSQSNFVRNQIREVARVEVSRLLGSTPTTSNSTAAGNESGHESNNERPPAGQLPVYMEAIKNLIIRRFP